MVLDSMRALVLLATSVVATSCTPRPASNEPASSDPGPTPTTQRASPPADSPSAAETFEAFESRLLAGHYRVEVTLQAEGAIEVSMRGALVWRDDRVELEADGMFAGRPATIELVADEQRMRGSGPGGALDLPTPPALRRAMVLGLTRMGLLHNVAVLVGGRPPDRSDGGVAQWVTVENVTTGRIVTEVQSPQGPPPSDPFSMNIEVDGRPAGRATLWTDPSSGLPVERHQVVDFPAGQMRVRETYRFVAL